MSGGRLVSGKRLQILKEFAEQGTMAPERREALRVVLRIFPRLTRIAVLAWSMRRSEGQAAEELGKKLDGELATALTYLEGIALKEGH